MLHFFLFLTTKRYPPISCEYIYTDGDKLHIEADTFSTYKYCLKIGSVVVDTGVVLKNKEFVLPKIIKNNTQYRKEIALDAAKNNNAHVISLLVNDIVDTTFRYQQIITEPKEENVSFTGFGVPLVPKARKESIDSELRIWLYRRNEHLNDSLFKAFKAVYSELSLSNFNDYMPDGKMPVVHDIDGKKYKINTEIQADYYAVVACKNQADITQFIEQLVGNNFEGVSTSLSSPLTCHYPKGITAYLNVFLLCINNDWTYKQIPLATFALDNSAPKSSLCDVSDMRNYLRRSKQNQAPIQTEPTSLTYSNGIRILYPNDRPKIYGNASVFITEWDGNGLECNVTFRVEFSGDTKSVTIQRRGELCDYDRYFGYRLKPEDKVIYAKDHNGSYTFTYKMHFNSGDNIIPVIIEDYNGNKEKGSITVNAKFVRSNAPSINIDNNIDIYN